MKVVRIIMIIFSIISVLVGAGLALYIYMSNYFNSLEFNETDSFFDGIEWD